MVIEEIIWKSLVIQSGSSIHLLLISRIIAGRVVELDLFYSHELSCNFIDESGILVKCLGEVTVSAIN